MTIQHESYVPSKRIPARTEAVKQAHLQLVPCVEADRGYVLALTQLTMLEAVHATYFSPEGVRHYFAQHGFDLADTALIHWRGRPAGRVTLHWGEAGGHLADLHIHPAYQGLGIGTAVLAHVRAEAKKRGVPVHTEVLRTNPALRLFQRMGFALGGASRHEFGLTLPAPGDVRGR